MEGRKKKGGRRRRIDERNRKEEWKYDDAGHEKHGKKELMKERRMK